VVKNMGVGARLGFGFGLVLVLMLASTALGVAQLSAMDDTIVRIAERDSNKAFLAFRIERGSLGNSRRLLEIVMAASPEQIAKSRRAWEEDAKAVEKAMAAVEPLLYTAEDRSIFARLKTARSAYAASQDKVIQMFDGNRHVEALDVLLKETLPLADAMIGAVGDFSQKQKELLDHSGVEAREAYGTALRTALALGLVALAIGIAAAIWIMRSVTRPVGRAADVAKALADGDLAQEVRVDSHDEVGQLMSALRDTVTQLAAIVRRIKQASEAINGTSTEIARGNADLSSRTEEQATALEQAAASMEEMTATVEQNAQSAKTANALATDALTVASEGGRMVEDVVHTMADISASSRKVSDIIGVIDGIAFQTNILALNAAVEAARAGEQGRGFAVVAAEVRSLAQRSAEAAREIKELITHSVDQVESGSRKVEAAGKTVGELVAAVRRVTDLVTEIAGASQQQSHGIRQISQTVTQLEQVTQQNAAMVEQANSAAAGLSNQAKNLFDAVTVFKLGNRDAGEPRAAAHDGNAHVAHAPRIERAPAAGRAAHPVAKARPADLRNRNTPHELEEWKEF
jgi:methyl-accepting chemotaxis protein